MNQFGGYTGMTPNDFKRFVLSVAHGADFPRERIFLGGDHLGPYPWRHETASSAMDKACRLTADSVIAGYTKIHLGASMPLAGDPVDGQHGIAPALIAEREAQLAEVAEAARAQRDNGTTSDAGSGPVYVIGTDVPTPGGVQAAEDGLFVTPVEEFETTVALCRQAFLKRGLHDAWDRVVAVVVQPGVEFEDQSVHPYERGRAAALCEAARRAPGVALEGHSTDYQTPTVLRRLVEDGLIILKVGPALTFAMREALFRLEAIERELPELASANHSNLSATLEAAMLENPTHWAGYYGGADTAIRYARKYSLSDRIRYYWSVPTVTAAVERLMTNLNNVDIPFSLLSQHLPHHFARIREERLTPRPEALVREAIRDVLWDYALATKP